MIFEENNGHSERGQVKLSPTLLNAVRQLNTFHLEIIRDEGQVAARLDEVEQFLEVRLKQVRSMRKDIREKQKRMREIESVIRECLIST